MSIKDILPKKDKKKDVQYFWALVIEPSWVQAGIWKIESRSAHILADSGTTAWSSDADLIEASDAALSSAVKKLDEMGDEPKKAVFGVVSSWVEEGEIKPEHLKKIKKVCEKLELDPVGFVVIPEAVAHYVKSQEGSPLNALVLGVFENEIEITIFNLGEIAAKEVVARSVSVADDVSEGLARLNLAKMPSRFIIYDGKEGELEEIRQSLLKASWDNLTDIEILHAPKVEILDSGQKVSAVSLAGASELSEIEKVVTKTRNDEDLSDLEKQEKDIEASERQNIVEPEESISPEDFGFVVGEDIARAEALEEKTYVPKGGDGDTSEVQNGKISIKTQEKESVKGKSDGKKEEGRGAKRKFLSGEFDKILNFFKVVFSRKILVFGVLAFLVFIGGLFSLWWFYPKANVTIYLTSQKLKEDFTIFADPGISEPDFSESIVPGETFSKSVEGEKTTPATGVKVVGEKATGEVTLYRVGSEITLNSGTTLGGPNGLNFALDNTINVASGSAGNPGETKAKVTAVDLGAEYNLASGTTFTVGDYSVSDVEAKNQDSFSGGSSKEINAVSESDREDLRKELIDELNERAVDEMKGEIESSDLLIEDSIEQDILSESFNHEVGDEATTLKLTLRVEVKALIIEKDVLGDFAKELLEDKVPDKFVLRNEQIKSSFDYKGQEDERYVLDVDVDANLLPAIDTEEIKNKITGKYPFLAEEYFEQEIPGFVRAEVLLKPSLPGRLRTLPHVSDNIEVEIASER